MISRHAFAVEVEFVVVILRGINCSILQVRLQYKGEMHRRISHINRCCSLVVTEVDSGGNMASDQVEIVPCMGDWTIVCIRCGGSRLAVIFHGDGAAESAVCVAIVWLRLRCNSNAVPAFEEATLSGQ